MIDFKTLSTPDLRRFSEAAEAELESRAARVLHAIGAVEAREIPNIHRVGVNENDVYVRHGLREENENWIPLATFELLGRPQ